MDDHVLEVIAGAFAPTPSGVVGRQIAESVVKALRDASYVVVMISLEQAPAIEPASPNTDQELKMSLEDRLARLEAFLVL